MNKQMTLSPLQLDALTEIGNIGAGHAATVLSQMLNERINMSVPRTSMIPLSQVSEIVGGAEASVVGVYIRVYGDAPGSILYIFPRHSAVQFVNILVGRHRGPANLLREFEQSALKEIGNILTGAFLHALASFTGLTMLPSVPAFAMDMAGAILNTVLLETETVANLAILIETEFTAKNQESRGQFFLLPDMGTLEVLLNAIGVDKGCRR